MIGLEEGGRRLDATVTSSRSSPSPPSGWSCSSPSSGGRRGADDPAAPVRQPGRADLRHRRACAPARSRSAPASSSRSTSRTRCSCRRPSPGLRMLPQMIGVTHRHVRHRPADPVDRAVQDVPGRRDGGRRRRAVRHQPHHRHDAVRLAGRADDRHGLRHGGGVHDDVDRHPERRRVPRPRRGHGHDHVLPHARRIGRARRVRHDPQRDGPRRDPATASASAPTRPPA